MPLKFDGSNGSDHITRIVVDDTAARYQRVFTDEVFMDASYEGDLMARADVPYRIGHEWRAVHGEYPAALSMGPAEQRCMGNHRTQAPNYRVTLTFNTANRVPSPKTNPVPSGGSISQIEDRV